MTLLASIISGASSDAPLSQLLRQLKVLQSRTQTPPLDEWVSRELEGYETADSLPPYRGPFPCMVLGHFIGPMGMEVKNAQIPASSVDGNFKELFNTRVYDSVSVLESYIRQDNVKLYWNPDMVAIYNYKVQQGEFQPVLNVQDVMPLTSAHVSVPGSLYIGILDQLRTKVLDLCLEIERVSPEIGELGVAREQNSAASSVITQFINSTGVFNVAAGQNSSVSVSLPLPGDEESLLRYLAAAGVPLDALTDLRAAISADRDSGVDNGKWAKVRAWGGTATTAFATGTLANLVPMAITAFTAAP